MKTLSSDRDIEWGWLKENLGPATLSANALLDFGPMPPSAPTSRLALSAGYHVTAVGLEEITLKHPNFTYIWGDVNAIEQPGRFNVIISISVFEHVGLGRYGDPIDPNADLRAMWRLREWASLPSRHIVTVPVGMGAVVGNYHRVYGSGRLWTLLDGWAIQEQKYWRKNDADEWEVCTKEQALAEQPTLLPVESPLHLYYAIGGFVLGG